MNRVSAQKRICSHHLQDLIELVKVLYRRIQDKLINVVMLRRTESSSGAWCFTCCRTGSRSGQQLNWMRIPKLYRVIDNWHHASLVLNYNACFLLLMKNRAPAMLAQKKIIKNGNYVPPSCSCVHVQRVDPRMSRRRRAPIPA